MQHPRPSLSSHRSARSRALPASIAVIAAALAVVHAKADSVTELRSQGRFQEGQRSIPADLDDAVNVSCGSYHVYALRPDGTLVGWGDNAFGQCDTPPEAIDIVQIDAGYFQTLALRQNGTVVVWGYDGWGLTQPPAGLSDVTQVACGDAFNYARKNDGTVVGWGYPDYVQTPPTLPPASEVACGSTFSFAVHPDGTITGWGQGWAGELDAPDGLSEVGQVSCGTNHAYARTFDGSLVGWGDNSFGQINTPGDLTGVTQVACGAYHTLALKQDGTIRAWGSNEWGAISFDSPPVTLAVRVSAGADLSYVLSDYGPDADGDGSGAYVDCNDGNAAVYPGAEEVEDGLDNDCNGISDDYWDHDGDGWIAAYDCDDADPAIHPDAVEICDGIDNDCDGEIDGPCALGGSCYDPTTCDRDGDGFPDADDCVPEDARVFPGATEWCDGIDNDCDGLVDNECIEDCDHDGVPDSTQIEQYWWLDLDRDGRIDACEIRDDPSLDCNQNWILDSIEVSDPALGGELDCDRNGQIDSCEIADDPSLDCNGNGFLDACDIASGYIEDCDGNLVPDSCEQFGRVVTSSGRMGPLGFNSVQTWTLPGAAPSLSGPFDSVRLDMQLRGDFAGAGEYLTVYLNGRFVGNVPGQGPYDCDPMGPMGGDHFDRSVNIPGNLWNYALGFGGGTMNIEFRPSIAVDPNRCPASDMSYVDASVEYTSTLEADCNQNGLLDVCEVVVAPWVDLNFNGVPDECDGSSTPGGCMGDADGSGWVDAADISLVLLAFGSPAMPGDPLDTDMSGVIDSADISVILLGFGPCR